MPARPELRALALALLASSVLPAAAQERQPSSFVVTPRLWYLIDTLTEAPRDTSFCLGPEFGVSCDDDDTRVQSESFTQAEPFALPMAGLSFAWQPGFLDRTIVTLTAAYGEADTHQQEMSNFFVKIQGVPQQNLAIKYDRDLALERTDVEFSVQRGVNDNLGLIGGLRWEHAETTVSNENALAVNALEGIGITFDETFLEGVLLNKEYDIYSLRAGLTGTIPLTKDFRHSMSATGLFFAGFQQLKPGFDGINDDERWLFGPDISAGYTYRINDNLSFDLRYRALFFYTDSEGASLKDPKSTHGLNLSLSYRFGGPKK